MANDRIHWDPSRHEARVEKFYGVGVENYGEYHGGYLNFGLWDDGITDYLAAAEHLVGHVGRLAGLTPESRLLDVACGMGPQDVFLCKTFGCTIDALDVTWKHVLHARDRAARAGMAGGITVHHGTATHLPFPDATFTQVTCIEGAEHVNTREDFFREARRVLKPGGVIVLTDYVLKRPPRNLYEYMVIEAARILWQVPKANYESVESYARAMERNGFRNVSIEQAGSRTIPGYYFETQRPENRARQRKIRGRIATALGFFVDYSVYKANRDGLIDYIFARGEAW